MTAKSTYAKSTSVSTGRSRDELEATLRRYGVVEFGVLNQPGALCLAFRAGIHHHRIVVPLPSADERRFRVTAQGRTKAATAAKAEFEQEVRARHRALLLLVKAKLELAQLTGQPVEAAFTEFRVLPGGQTVQEMVTGTGDVPAIGWSG